MLRIYPAPPSRPYAGSRLLPIPVSRTLAGTPPATGLLPLARRIIPQRLRLKTRFGPSQLAKQRKAPALLFKAAISMQVLASAPTAGSSPFSPGTSPTCPGMRLNFSSPPSRKTARFRNPSRSRAAMGAPAFSPNGAAMARFTLFGMRPGEAISTAGRRAAKRSRSRALRAIFPCRFGTFTQRATPCSPAARFI